MQIKFNRRSFIRRSVLAAGAAPFITFPNILSARNPSGKLNCVQVGCGGRAMQHLEQVIYRYGQNLTAIVDPDRKGHGRVWNYLNKQNIDTSNLRAFNDYRSMFDKMGKNIDAVFITTPNHHHATVALMALERGINVYCEKPLCHDIAEARRLREAAHKYNKVATQMGNQGHCEDGYRQLCEYIWGGVIGKVTETHSWTDRANGGGGARPPGDPGPP